jgi:hypothetical protein
MKHPERIKETEQVVFGSSCLTPEFSISIHVGGLKKLIKDLKDEDFLHITLREELKPDNTSNHYTIYEVSREEK